MVKVKTSPTQVTVRTINRAIVVADTTPLLACDVGVSRQVTQVSTNRLCVTYINPASAPTQDDPLVIQLIAAVDIKKGQPVYVTNTGKLDLATSLIPCEGVAAADGAAGIYTPYISDGSVVRSDWSGIAENLELIPGSIYYLSDNGTLTRTVPTDNILQQVGVAVSHYTLDVEIHPAILLAN